MPSQYEMEKFNAEQAFNVAFIARVKALRLAMKPPVTAERMAGMLGIPAERYRKYESRTPLPHYLLARFAGLTHAPINYLLFGETANAQKQKAGDGARAGDGSRDMPHTHLPEQARLAVQALQARRGRAAKKRGKPKLPPPARSSVDKSPRK